MSTRREFLTQTAATGIVAAGAAHVAPAAANTSASLHKAPRKEGVLQPVDLKRVTLAGEFGRRVERIIEANILKIDIEETFLARFRKRGKWEPSSGYVGLGKFIDAVVRLAAGTGDRRLVELKKNTIVGLLATQDSGGYVGLFEDPKDRTWAPFGLHEDGYLIWGLLSDFEYFGERSSLKAAQKLANYLIALLTANPGLLMDNPAGLVKGNRDPRMAFSFSMSRVGFDRALVALSRVTGEEKYRDFVVGTLKLNEFDPPIHAGAGLIKDHGYVYLANSLAQLDLYRETGNPQLLSATRRAITFMRKGDGMLVTGSATDAECWHDTQSGLLFTAETCMGAYIARIMDAMLRLEGDSLYGDIMERDIYNALFAATAPDGSKSRYWTPFEGKRVYDKHGNRFCCANNNKRFLADLGSWMYYRTASGVAINLYNASTATLTVASNVELKIEQQTDYPTSDDVRIKIDPAEQAHFDVKLRIPRWCKAASVAVNGAAVQTVRGGQFHVIERLWKPGDVIDLKMPMHWRFIRGRRSQEGRAAILRGPVVFTFNPERNSKITRDQNFEPRLMAIDPLQVEPPARDDSVRPDGVACTVKAWPAGQIPSPGAERVPLVLTEYPDPEGSGVYFIVPTWASSTLVDDELI